MKNVDQNNTQDINAKDIHHAIEIGERIWWVGHYLHDDIFQCHAYLIEQGDQSALIDPGGYLTFKQVYQKVEEIIPFSHIRYFICQHQDPDITGSLKLIDSMPDHRKDAVIVTHWRVKALLKHYDLTLPFWDIEEHGWKLDLDGRVVKFIFTPYLHFAGAFCTFDTVTGILFSSDIFGGFTSGWSLVARDESYFEAIRPFHEHYMASNEILIHGLMQLEKYPIKMIAPQHGSIIPNHLVSFMFGKLKQVDCGLFALAKDETDVHRLSFLNKTLRDITNAVIVYRDFRDIVTALLDIFRKTLPIISIEFYAYTSKKETLFLAPETRYYGVVSGWPSFCESISGMDKQSWLARNRGYCKEILLPSKTTSADGKGNDRSLLIPLFSHDGGVVRAVAILRLAHDIEITYEIERMSEQISDVLGVAVERECFYRMIEFERKKFYEQSIRDALTGLYNRMYMEETMKRLMYMHDRNEKDIITVVMLDIDYFKKINDTYGHTAGDDVIRKVASTIKGCIRFSDLPVRYGGEEFAIFLTGYSVKEGIMMAEKIRHKVSQIAFDGLPGTCKITISAGVASRRQKESFTAFVQRADKALYNAKNTGRNKVCSAED